MIHGTLIEDRVSPLLFARTEAYCGNPEFSCRGHSVGRERPPARRGRVPERSLACGQSRSHQGVVLFERPCRIVLIGFEHQASMRRLGVGQDLDMSAVREKILYLLER